MKKFLLILFLLFSFVPLVCASDVKIYLFYSDSCPHCKNEKKFLSTLDDVDVISYEVSNNSDLFIKVNNKLNINSNSVPLTIIGSDYVVGYSDNIKRQILDMVDSYSKNDYCDAVDLIIENKDINDCLNINNGLYNASEEKIITIFNHEFKFNAKSISLPLISIIIGFIDGFNPCAMWILIFLISMLFNMKNRKKMLILGLTFLITSALVYLIFMFGILKIANSFTSFKYIIALVALIGGIINLNSFRKSLKKDVGCQVTNKTRRKKITERIKKILSEKSFLISIIGIVLLAISVNFVELACSAGLPTMFIEILSLNNLSNMEYWLYMIIYILTFMLDDIVIFLIAITTLRIKGISNKYTKYSHLVGGIIMLIIGILMIFKVDWLMFNF